MLLKRLMSMAFACLVAANPGLAEAGNTRRNLTGATAAMSDQRDGGPGGMSEAELQGAGCLLSGSFATLASYAADANEVVLVVAGGTLAPSTPTLLGIVLLSTIFTSGCAVGAIVAPFAYWAYRETALVVGLDSAYSAPQ